MVQIRPEQISRVSNPATGNTIPLRNSDGDIRNLKYTTSITSTATA